MRAMRRKQSCQLVSDSPEQSQQLGCTWLTMQRQETINNKHCAKQTYRARLRKTWPIKASTLHSGASKLGSAMSESLHRQRGSPPPRGPADWWHISGFVSAMVELLTWLVRGVRMWRIGWINCLRPLSSNVFLRALGTSLAHYFYSTVSS